MTDARPLWDMAAGSASRIMDLIRGLRGLAPAASMLVSHDLLKACFTVVHIWCGPVPWAAFESLLVRAAFKD